MNNNNNTTSLPPFVALIQTTIANVNVTTCQAYHTNFEYLMFFLDTYYQMFLIIFGCMGNSFTIIIFWRTKYAHSLRTSFYLICLAISDIAMLITLLIQYLDKREYLPDSISIDRSSFVCKSITYLGFVINFVSVGLVTAFTLQRLCIIVFPLRVHKYTMESKSKFVVLFLVLFGFLIYTYYLNIYDLTLVPTGDINNTLKLICWTKDGFNKTAEQLHILDSIITMIFPFLGLLIMNAIIIRTLKNSSYNFANRTTSTMKKISFKRVDNKIVSNQNNQSPKKKPYVMCRCHQDKFIKLEEVPVRLKDDPNLDCKQLNNKDFCHQRASDMNDDFFRFKQNSLPNFSEENSVVRYKSKDRRNSFEIQLTRNGKSSSKKLTKKFLVNYKFNTKDSKNNTDRELYATDQNNHTDQYNADVKCTCNQTINSKSFRDRFIIKRQSKDVVSSHKSSFRSNRAMSFRISGNKSNTVSRKITKMLIIVSTTFLILNLPIHSFNLYIYIIMGFRSKDERKYDCYENYIRVIVYHLFFTSFSCNFLLYSISGVMFRNECKKLIFKILRIDSGTKKR